MIVIPLSAPPPTLFVHDKAASVIRVAVPVTVVEVF